MLVCTLQLHGDSFDLSVLSQLAHNSFFSISSKRFENVDSELNELLCTLEVITMNLVVNEATKLALEQKNLQLLIPQKNGDQNDNDNWGEIDAISV